MGAGNEVEARRPIVTDSGHGMDGIGRRSVRVPKPSVGPERVRGQLLTVGVQCEIFGHVVVTLFQLRHQAFVGKIERVRILPVAMDDSV